MLTDSAFQLFTFDEPAARSSISMWRRKVAPNDGLPAGTRKGGHLAPAVRRSFALEKSESSGFGCSFPLVSGTIKDSRVDLALTRVVERQQKSGRTFSRPMAMLIAAAALGVSRQRNFKFATRRHQAGAGCSSSRPSDRGSRGGRCPSGTHDPQRETKETCSLASGDRSKIKAHLLASILSRVSQFRVLVRGL
jgi:hypothetical protein